VVALLVAQVAAAPLAGAALDLNTPEDYARAAWSD
jgi:hypothetical protein